MKCLIRWIWILLLNLYAWPALALHWEDVPFETFDTLYQNLDQQKNDLRTQLHGNSVPYIHDKAARGRLNLSRSQKRIAENYLKVSDDWHKLDPVKHLRDDLVAKYATFHQSPASDAVKLEATRIALHLFITTKNLRQKFNMSPVPLWQNTLVNLKIRERGFCYHWATDILETLKPMPREFFNVTWAESRPDTPHEHNVTVIFPKGDEFQNGLLFDPWRKGGKPYWRTPASDTHFHWKKWDGYGIY